ncbi:uncharacterized protein LOC111618986 [Centruroides sculpturatus]|uniref:uncharacterized protein LOC111618986 n=1 Tax=Centruroides sculpturatus TaxID=218467 RepID=UPI000C6E2559|nr:uncharacterized protein LOC111618986 [Centruroides sculpturatus]
MPVLQLGVFNNENQLDINLKKGKVPICYMDDVEMDVTKNTFHLSPSFQGNVNSNLKNFSGTWPRSKVKGNLSLPSLWVSENTNREREIKSEERCIPRSPKTIGAGLGTVLEMQKEHDKMSRHSPTQKDEFWEALWSHYDCLMDDGLIASCREASGELSLDGEVVSPDYTWSFTEFIQQFNQLHDWLHKLQSTVVVNTEDDDKTVVKSTVEELQKVAFRCKLFNEQAQHLDKRYPDMKDEINRRLNLLNNKWEAVEQAVNPHKPQQNEDGISQEVGYQMRCLRKWLRELENDLSPMTISPAWTLQDLENKYKEQLALQKKIESRGKYVSALLKSCDRLVSCRVDDTGPPLSWDAHHIRKVASNLEKRWHALWLKSLERQCLLEEFLKKYRSVSIFSVEVTLLRQRIEIHETRKMRSGERTYPFRTMDPSVIIYLVQIIRALQKKIESRGKYVSALLKSCDRLVSCRVDDTGPPLSWDAHHIRKVASNLEKRWHALWLKSLERQCLLEEFLKKYRSGCMSGDSSFELSFSEEPLTKYPKLSSDWEDSFLLRHADGTNPMDSELTDYEGMKADDKMEECMKPVQQDNCEISEDNTNTNDKGVMVGMTGIADLKAECGGNIGRFEIIQDVGYSSESSAHLSNDEKQEFIRVYSYSPVCSGPSLISEYAVTNSTPKTLDNKPSSSNSSNLYLPPDKYPSISLKDWQFVTGEEPFYKLKNKTESLTTPSSTFYKMTSIDPDAVEESAIIENVFEDKHTSDENFKQDNIELMDDSVNSISFCPAPKEDSKLSTNDLSTSVTQVQSSSDVIKMKQLLAWAEVPNKNSSVHLRNIASGKKLTKNAHIREWLENCQEGKIYSKIENNIENKVMNNHLLVDSSCDASGEYTTNESDSEQSSSSADVNNSLIMSRSNTGSVETVIPVVEESSGNVWSGSSSVTMRNKRKSFKDRPWSVTEIGHVTSGLRFSPLSTSEGSLNILCSSQFNKTIDSKYRSSKWSIGAQKHLSDDKSRSLGNKPRRNRSRSSLQNTSHRSDSGSDNLSPNTTCSTLCQSNCSDLQISTPTRRRKSNSILSDKFAIHLSPVHRSPARRFSNSRSSSSNSSGKKRNTQSSSDNYQNTKTWPVSHSEPENLSAAQLPSSSVADSDQALTQTEDQSSVSDQVWDGYQDPPYFSEPYSEQALNDEEVRKLIEFGDDYGAYLGCHSDASSFSDGRNLTRMHISHSRSQVSKNYEPYSEQALNDEEVRKLIEFGDDYGAYLGCHSDASSFSDGRNLTRMHISHSRSQDPPYFSEPYSEQALNDEEVRKLIEFGDDYGAYLGCHSDASSFSDGRNLTRMHISHSRSQLQAELYATCETHLNCLQVISDHLTKSDKTIGNEDFNQLTNLIEEWKSLQQSVASKQKSNCARQLSAEYVAIQKSLNELAEKISQLTTTPFQRNTTLDILQERIAALQMSRSTLQETKDSLLEVSKRIVRLMSEADLMTCPLKEHFNKLYQRWEDIYEENGTHLTDLQQLYQKWNNCDVLCQQLQKTLEATRSSEVNKEIVESAEKQLDKLRTMLAEVKDLLGTGEPWKKLAERVADLQSKIYVRDVSCAPVHTEQPGPTKRFWRIIRFAIPIQLALVLLYCLACLLEPRCCDLVNNLNFSLTPHLRYVRGPPPV